MLLLSLCIKGQMKLKMTTMALKKKRKKRKS
jgi:hypothetical protein